MSHLRFFPILLLVLCGLVTLPADAAELKTRNVIFISTDGFRWQELFRGADAALMNKEFGGVTDAAKLTEEFGGETPAARRAKLLPFLWGVVARQGQIFGNRDLGSLADVTNTKWFSYPGYSEFLTGHADDERILSNRAIPNPNVNVLEWLQGRPGFAGKVLACNAWQVLPAILNAERSHLPMWTYGVPTAPELLTPRLAELEKLMADIPSPWPDEHFDAFVQQAALELIDQQHPRVFYLNFGETDEWAHARRYDTYLQAAHRVDRWIQELWEKLQATPQYRGTTTLIITTDHGRGRTPKDWTSHGEKVPDSGQMWLAVLGPDTPARGERRETPPIKQAQVAATLARLLGEEYRAAVPEAAPALAEVLAAE